MENKVEGYGYDQLVWAGSGYQGLYIHHGFPKLFSQQQAGQDAMPARDFMAKVEKSVKFSQKNFFCLL